MSVGNKFNHLKLSY